MEACLRQDLVLADPKLSLALYLYALGDVFGFPLE